MLPVNPKFHTEHIDDKSVPILNDSKLRLIEETTVLSIAEKINILALFLGHKWITDIAIDQPDKIAASAILRQLELPHEENYYKDKERIRHSWLQVAANKAILRYILGNRENLSVIEAGVLYGYPVSHSLGYTQMLEKHMKGENKTIAEFYLSGIFSQKYNKRETEYFEKVWRDITKQSPVITHEARQHYDHSEYTSGVQQD